MTLNLINRIKDFFNTNLRIRGIVFKGLGVASKTLEKQMQIFKHTIPNLRNYHIGTINVLTEKVIVFNKPPIQTDFIQWDKDFPHEQFKFVPCEIECNSRRIKAMIYIPSWSPHTPSTRKWEVIASENLGKVESGDLVTLIFSDYIVNRKWAALI